MRNYWAKTKEIEIGNSHFVCGVDWMPKRWFGFRIENLLDTPSVVKYLRPVKGWWISFRFFTFGAYGMLTNKVCTGYQHEIKNA